MKFVLVDQIQSIEPGKRIVGRKCLTAAEEYLADHFPAFPVMPGVLMLETCVQTAAWLVRLMTDWQRSTVVLKRARNVRYASFVAPGDTLEVEAQFMKQDQDVYQFKCTGRVGDKTTVQARIELRATNLADKNPSLARADREILAQLQERFELCGGPAAVTAQQAQV
jgi:3-hydroxyacyl-[acyl-carrier-protein] dehydratase